MKILDKIKNLIPKKKFLKKNLYWILPLAVILAILLIMRGCSHNPMLAGKKSFTIGRENDWQIELLGRERSLIGFTNDLMARIAEEHGLRFNWVETNPNNLVKGLENGTYDFILTIMRPNVINHEEFDFSELLFDLGPVLIVREDWQITTLKEMRSKPIGISYGFATNFNAVRTPGVNVYDLTLIYYNNMNRALEDLSNDKIDGVIMKAIPAYAITLGLYAGRLKVVTAPFNDEGLRIVSRKNSSFDHIIDLINKTVDKMRLDGAYKSLIEKWNLIDPQSQFWHPPENTDEHMVQPNKIP